MLVDLAFIYSLFVLAVISMIVGLVIGYYAFKKWTGVVSQQFLSARRKVQSIVIQLAPNNMWRFIPVSKKFGNVWYTEDGPITVTAAHVHPLVGMMPTVIETTLSAEPNEQFAAYAADLAAKSPKPPQLIDIVTFLKKREAALSDVINAVVNINAGKSNLRDAVEQIMIKRKVPIQDELAYQAIAQRLDAAVKSKAQDYMAEFQRVTTALTITKPAKTFDFKTNELGDVIDVVSKETLEADDFLALTPAGTVNDVQTVSQRNEAVAVKEAMFSMNSAMKYITFAVVIFIILAGLAFFLKSQGA